MHGLDATLAILRSTPSMLAALTEHMTDAIADARYGPGTFSPRDVVGHLILGERLDWIPRTRHLLEHGESIPFEPFPWDGVDSETRDLAMRDRIAVFAELRTRNIDALEALALDDKALERTGLHPRLGVITLRQMLTTWGVHDLHHAAQICKAVNYQFRDAIGPWRPFVNSVPPDPA